MTTGCTISLPAICWTALAFSIAIFCTVSSTLPKVSKVCARFSSAVAIVSTIAGTLFNQAKEGNTAAAIFWLKTRARWKETHAHEITGADGKPLEFNKIERVIIKNG